jgi:anti-anti-sigma factor
VGRLVELEVEERDDVVVARITGELDIAEAASTGDAVLAAVPSAAHGLVLDLCDLSFIDSSGIAMLFALARQLSSRRQLLRVAARPDGPVWRVLEIVELSRAAPVHDSREAALTDLESSLA